MNAPSVSSVPAFVHLTYTGFDAGKLLCDGPRLPEGEYAHATYAPLHLEEYRAKCCPQCLKVFADYAYNDGDEMPAWVAELRNPEPSPAPVA